MLPPSQIALATASVVLEMSNLRAVADEAHASAAAASVIAYGFAFFVFTVEDGRAVAAANKTPWPKPCRQ